ncbi:hypothetical protein Tco_1144652 [Tanacetum coccineum]
MSVRYLSSVALLYTTKTSPRPLVEVLRQDEGFKESPWSILLVMDIRSYSTTKPFTFNLYHDGVFIERPPEYTNGDFKVIDDVDFDGLVYVQMYDIIRRVVLVSPTCLYFKLVDQPLVCHKPLKTDEDVGLFVKALYKNGSIIDLYCKHNGYDIMEMIEDQIAPKDQAVKTPFKCNADDYAHSTYKNLEDLKGIVDIEVEGEENIVIPKNTTNDPWLNKLVGKGNFLGHSDDPTAK